MSSRKTITITTVKPDFPAREYLSSTSAGIEPLFTSIYRRGNTPSISREVTVKWGYGEGDQKDVTESDQLDLTLSEIGLLTCIGYEQTVILRGRGVMTRSAKRLASAGLLEENPTCRGEYRRTDEGERILAQIQRQFK